MNSYMTMLRRARDTLKCVMMLVVLIIILLTRNIYFAINQAYWELFQSYSLWISVGTLSFIEFNTTKLFFQLQPSKHQYRQRWLRQILGIAHRWEYKKIEDFIINIIPWLFLQVSTQEEILDSESTDSFSNFL